MITDTRATDLCISGPLGDREFRRLAAILGLASVVAITALFAKLLIFPGMHLWGVSAPVISRTTSIANDLTAIRSGLPPVSEYRPGSGHVEFEPPPAGPQGTVGLSHASPIEQTDEPVKPAGRIVARAQSALLAGE